jgi:acetolactate synthase-1/2/3 large subunit
VHSANYPARLCVVATASAALARMEAAAFAGATKWSSPAIEETRKQLREPAAQAVEPVIQGKTAVTPAAFFAWLREALPRETILVTDSGLHQILTRRHYDVLSARGLIVPSDFQSMGFGLPASIGAKTAAAHRPVVALIGDGGFLMSGLELLTAVRERLPLLVIVFNDGKLNQIRLQQLENFGRTQAVSLENPDFAALAEALDAGYLRFGAASHDDVRAALQAAGPTLLEVEVGDSAAIRSMRRRALVKALGRRVLGARLKGWMKKLLRRQGA